MEILRAEDGVTKAIESWLEDRITRHGARSLFLPAGETPKPLYALWRQAKPTYLQGITLLQVDDVITGNQKGIFRRFFQTELPDFAVLPPTTEKKADLAILGLGTNGHVAFHEPGMPLSFRFGEVDLAPDTKQRLALENEARGITYGVGVFREAKAILLVVTGSSKAPILQRLRAKDPSLPATGLLDHPDLTLLTDLPL